MVYICSSRYVYRVSNDPTIIECIHLRDLADRVCSLNGVTCQDSVIYRYKPWQVSAVCSRIISVLSEPSLIFVLCSDDIFLKKKNFSKLHKEIYY